MCDALLLISQFSHLLLHLLVATAQGLVYGLQLKEERKSWLGLGKGEKNITEEHQIDGERQGVGKENRQDDSVQEG